MEIFNKKSSGILRKLKLGVAAIFVAMVFFAANIPMANAMALGGAGGWAFGWSSGIFHTISGGGLNGGKVGAGGGQEFDPVAALIAAMTGKFQDQNFINALFNMMLQQAAEGYTNTNPTAQDLVTWLSKQDSTLTKQAETKIAEQGLTKVDPKALTAQQLTDYNSVVASNSAKVTNIMTTVKQMKSNGDSQDAIDYVAQVLTSNPGWRYDSGTGFFNDKNTKDDNAGLADDALRSIVDGISVSRDPGKAACDSLLVGGKYAPGGWLSDNDPGGDDSGSSGGPSGVSTPTPVKPTIKNETSAEQTTAQVSLSVSTNRTSKCQYSTSSSFTYGSGTDFSTTGQYNHNTSVDGTKHPYYVACKDVDTAGISATIKVDFTVDLSRDPNNAPKITVETPATQTDASPKLAVTTDRNATCKFLKGGTLTYATNGEAMTADTTRRAHTVSLASYADGDYTFNVACRDDVTGAVSDVKVINTKLSRVTGGNAPVITNMTAQYQSSASTTIEVSTTRAAICKYRKTDNFTYDDNTGTVFSTDTAATGTTSHVSALIGLASGSQTFYVVCKDVASSATNSTGTQIMFTVSSHAPEVMNITPASQTGSDPKLTVTTDMKAVCKYKKGTATFDYATDGTEMAPDNNWQSHSVFLTSLSDGSYDFIVICRDYLNSNSYSDKKQVTTSINRATIDANAPTVTNKTAGFQTVNNPKLEVSTDKDSNCKYATNDFDYATGGTLFAVTGNTTHSVELRNLPNGQHAYYVVCQRISNNVISPKGYQVIFTTNTSGDANACNNLSSNDRKNDGNRSFTNDREGDSVYPWQSVETGTREKFSKVDWFAGYQFTPKKDGQVTQLCGYFESGATNEISLFNGSYTELANAKIAGNGKWKCADVAPAEIKADGRYYVITRVENGPIFYEYKSGLFPIEANNIVIEAGIRQTVAEDGSMTGIIKYDYMIFGLIDIKVSYVSVSTTGPEITSAGPKGTVYNASTSITALTADNSSCRFDREDVEYSQMAYNMPWTASGAYGQKICGLEDGDYTFYVRCKDGSGKANNGSKMVKFKVEQ